MPYNIATTDTTLDRVEFSDVYNAATTTNYNVCAFFSYLYTHRLL